MGDDRVLTIEDFRRWGSIGGKAKSLKKSKASKSNGKKGGRPKKKPKAAEESKDARRKTN